jgi:hypothetical protein
MRQWAGHLGESLNGNVIFLNLKIGNRFNKQLATWISSLSMVFINNIKTFAFMTVVTQYAV